MSCNCDKCCSVISTLGTMEAAQAPFDHTVCDSKIAELQVENARLRAGFEAGMRHGIEVGKQAGASKSDLKCLGELLDATYKRGLKQGRAEQRERDAESVRDLAFAFREIKGKPRLTDLMKLARRIRAQSDEVSDEK